MLLHAKTDIDNGTKKILSALTCTSEEAEELIKSLKENVRLWSDRALRMRRVIFIHQLAMMFLLEAHDMLSKKSRPLISEKLLESYNELVIVQIRLIELRAKWQGKEEITSEPFGDRAAYLFAQIVDKNQHLYPKMSMFTSYIRAIMHCDESLKHSQQILGNTRARIDISLNQIFRDYMQLKRMQACKAAGPQYHIIHDAVMKK